MAKVKKRKLKQRIKEANNETELYADFATEFRRQRDDAREIIDQLVTQMDALIVERRGAVDARDRSVQERDLAKQDADKLAEVRRIVWDPMIQWNRALLEVRLLVGPDPKQSARGH